MLTDDQINAMHRRIWARQQAEQAAQLGDPEVMRLVQEACQIEASYIRLWPDEITARTRTAKTFEEIVQGVVRVKRDRPTADRWQIRRLSQRPSKHIANASGLGRSDREGACAMQTAGSPFNL
jgi:hypothetical protein